MIDIVLTINEGYIFHSKVLLNSIFKNTKCSNFFIRILAKEQFQFEVQNEYNVFFKKAFPLKNIQFEFLQVDETLIKDLPIKSHPFSREVYYRLLIPLLMPDTLEKVIYLDADMIIERDIQELFEVNIDEYSIAAVSNLIPENFDILGLDKEEEYFNAGLLLMNLKRIRDNNEVDHIIKYGVTNKDIIRLADQDILNGFYKNNHLKLPLIWNWQNHFYQMESKIKNYSSLVGEKKVYHFSFETKPWHFINIQKDRNKYKEYAKSFVEYADLFHEREILKEYNLYIWGTGSVAQEVIGILNEESLAINGVIDSDFAKDSKLFLNQFEVRHPSKVLSKLTERDLVIIASSYYDEIMQQYAGYKDIFTPFSKIHTLT